jgi:S1-C subfamily serine protease
MVEVEKGSREMFLSRLIPIRALMIVAGGCLSVCVLAQTPSPKKSVPADRVNRPSTASDPRLTAPQVVTIVHRLNGIKIFRMLLRSQEQVEAIANFDDAFNLTDEVHTNIIAGLAMDDGRTIAAWLPEAEVEFGPSLFPLAAPRAPHVKNPAKTFPSRPMPKLEQTNFPFRGGMFGPPDLTVISPEGKSLPAEYIGLDGVTGLSILRLSDSNLTVNTTNGDEAAVGEGENVRLISPERAASTRPIGAGSLYVRMGTTVGTILSIKRAPSGGGVARFKVKSPRLSLANIGGVAVNNGGETVGIVDAVEGPEATVLPTALIRRAAKRVLARQASVPRPWLGVKGEPVARLNVDQIRNQGWGLERAASLLERQRGILLTSIAAGSPAANAALRAGDVILKVNNEDVHNDDDFSWMLDQAGPSSSVTFTLARPDRVAEEAINVELSGLLSPGFNFTSGPATTASLMSQGIETVALKPAVAARFGASSGLLIVYVDPSTAAFDAGLLPGDVIESIDGKAVPSSDSVASTAFTAGETSSFEIVRKKKKLVVNVNMPEKKN